MSGPPGSTLQILLMLTVELERLGPLPASDGPKPGRLIYSIGFPGLKVDVGLCQRSFQLIRKALFCVSA